MNKGTEIGEVRGLGSAHHGAGHWLLMQATSAGALITCAYLVISFLLLPDLSYETVSGWLTHLGPSFALALLIVAVFWHARLGLQVMIEDYVDHPGRRFAALLTLNLAAFAGAAFGLICLARIVIEAAGQAATKAAAAQAMQAIQGMMQGGGGM
jgi:succinate dehydrogenase / fumarate reductase membrane anchor subunit